MRGWGGRGKIDDIPKLPVLDRRSEGVRGGGAKDQFWFTNYVKLVPMIRTDSVYSEVGRLWASESGVKGRLGWVNKCQRAWMTECGGNNNRM